MGCEPPYDPEAQQVRNSPSTLCIVAEDYLMIIVVLWGVLSLNGYAPESCGGSHPILSPSLFRQYLYSLLLNQRIFIYLLLLLLCM